MPGDAGASEPTDRYGTAAAAATYLTVAAVLALWVWASERFFGHAAEHTEAVFPGAGLLRGWTQFDAGWYANIADHGYLYVEGRQSNVAFFPLYPATMRALRPLTGSAYAAGIVVTFVSGLSAVLLLRRWCAERLDGNALRLAVVAMVVYPYSWYLVGAGYSDALFIALTLVAFTALERDRPVLAGLAGALATATRVVGPAVALALVVRQLERRGALRSTERHVAGRTVTLPCGVDLRRLHRVDYALVLSGVGFAGYSTYLWVRWGDPLLFSTVQKYWNQPGGLVTLLKLHLGGIILFKFGDRWLYIAGCLFQGVLSLGALALVPRLRRRFGWGYATLVAACLAIPLIGSKDFQGLGRYLLVAFPLFAWGGERLAAGDVRTRRAVIAASAALLLLWSHLYARGYYVA